ncbi:MULTISPECIES: hypothetical protein [Streptomyces]|uniref:Uncharacterized protein n=1 Tax=Streptomyces dengpaensis TaxID=2049881 RepID=A0ABM6STF7_9ACTN|nr:MULTISPECIES: hypothetical protein [Streptomyces]AVH57975.1 hypothetical protein C4B68_21875 [Streptomyces dengpaensis]PIB06530.1 hypothetical protein B1C81_24350 [Streptomyces sp. HG99]
MIFFQLVGAVLEFGVSQTLQTKFGIAGAGLFLLALMPLLLRHLVRAIVRTVHSNPGWWAAGLAVVLLALCLHA